jgi:hypothetical protein
MEIQNWNLPYRNLEHSYYTELFTGYFVTYPPHKVVYYMLRSKEKKGKMQREKLRVHEQNGEFLNKMCNWWL